ncbi:MAG: tetratricopeptide repeat protein [Rikenellaceae bacterium]
MKKITLIAVAIFMMVASAQVMAQAVDRAGITSKVEKADADSKNPKKNIKAATWLKRGDMYYMAATTPTKELYSGMPLTLLKSAVGNPKGTKQVKVNGKQMQMLTYPYFAAYVQNNKVVSWKVTTQIKPNALYEAIKSYNKAAEVDPAATAKAKAGLEKIVNYCSELGNISIPSANYLLGAQAYLTAYTAQKGKAYGAKPNSTLVYHAGYLFTIDGAKVPASYAKGEKSLRDALKSDYLAVEKAGKEVDEKEKGNLYYYMYHCVVGQKDKVTDERLKEVKDLMIKGIAEYPQNEKILESLMQLYADHPTVGDSKELLTMVENALKSDPKNVGIWFGRGRIYFAMKNYDECVKSFEQVVKLAPKSFDGSYYLGVFCTLQGDEMYEAMKTKTYTSQDAYNADLAKVNACYAKAIPAFEKAHTIKPKDFSTIEYLKSLCYRLRDEEGMMPKYEKYNELFKTMKK